MSDPKHIPGTDGWTADEWQQADPHAQETTAADWGEDWEAYEQAHERVQEERKVQKAGLIWQG
jgi:hypothetical protein